MRTVKRYTLRQESWEKQREKSRYNPGLEIVLGNTVILPLSSGTSDHIYLFTEGKHDDKMYYVLSVNYRLGYVGLTEYDATGETMGDVFIDRDYEIEEVFNKKFNDYGPMTLCKILVEHLPY